MIDAVNQVDGAPPIVNLPARIAIMSDGPAKLDMLERVRAPLILSSVGDPTRGPNLQRRG